MQVPNRVVSWHLPTPFLYPTSRTSLPLPLHSRTDNVPNMPRYFAFAWLWQYTYHFWKSSDLWELRSFIAVATTALLETEVSASMLNVCSFKLSSCSYHHKRDHYRSTRWKEWHRLQSRFPRAFSQFIFQIAFIKVYTHRLPAPSLPR